MMVMRRGGDDRCAESDRGCGREDSRFTKTLSENSPSTAPSSEDSRSTTAPDLSEASHQSSTQSPPRSMEVGAAGGPEGSLVEHRILESLPPELLMLVAEKLDAPRLARFAAASTACLAAAHGELRAALGTAVQRYLEPGAGPVSDALISCPYVCHTELEPQAACPLCYFTHTVEQLPRTVLPS